MQPYGDVGGDSGIVAYESGPDFIRVEFGDGGVYVYTHRSAGTHHLERMKVLAAAGRGLNTYLNKHVHKKYERNER